MALQAAMKGARYTAQLITWTDADGTVKNLTGATLTGTILPRRGTARAIDGTLSLTDAANGVFSWTYGANDVQAVGQFSVQFKATVGSVYDLSLPQPWVVRPDIGA